MRNLTGAIMIGALLVAETSWAGEMAILQRDDGSHGTLYDFGAVELYNDSQGATGTIYDFGTIQRYQVNSPSGQHQSGTIYRFGSPQVGPTIQAPQNTPVAPLFPMFPYTGAIQPSPVAPHSGLGNSMIGPGGVVGGMDGSKGR